jgi:MFS family permease
MQIAVAPLLPTYAHHFGLTKFGQGLLLAATGLATLAVAVPSGALADRFSARRVTIASGALMAAAALLQAVAPTFPVLLLARLLFGAGYGVTWTAGLSWLAEVSPGTSSLGGSVASAGLGNVLGPVLYGLLVEHLGLAWPFVGTAVLFAAVTGALVGIGGKTPLPAVQPSVSHSLLLAAHDRLTVSATAAIVVAGVSSGVAYLLAPGILEAHGATTGMIGLVFSGAGLLFVAGSAITTWFGQSAVRLRVAVVGMMTLALTMSPAAASSASIAVIAMLWATSAARSVIWTVAYPLGAEGAETTGAGVGLVMGLLNGVWAATAVLTPLVAGIVAEHSSGRVVFGLAELSSMVMVVMLAAWISRSSRSTLRRLIRGE